MSSWVSILNFLVSLLGGLIVMESRRASGHHCSLLFLRRSCCSIDGLSSCSGVAFSLDVLQEERLVSLKVGVVINLKGIILAIVWEKSPSSPPSTLPPSQPCLTMETKSSFLAGYEALACVLSTTSLGLALLEVLLALPDIKWPLRAWCHTCGSCLSGQ